MASNLSRGATKSKGKSLRKCDENQAPRSQKDNTQKPNIPEPYTDDEPAKWNNMFGSLMSVSKASQEQRIELTENWHMIIRRWYPDLHKKVYSAPPVHFRAVSYKPKPENPRQPLEPYLRFGMRMYQDTQYSTVKDDEAQQRVLRTFSAFCRKKSGAAFILSNMEFQNYLNKHYDLPDSVAEDLPKPDVNVLKDGDLDVLIVDKQHGVLVLEVKAIGRDPPQVRTVTKEKQIEELIEKFPKIRDQVKKELEFVTEFLSDLNMNKEIKVKGGYVFANVGRNLYKEALELYGQRCQTQEMQKDFKFSLEEIIQTTFCAEEFPDQSVSPESSMDEAMFQRIEKIWTGFEKVYGISKPMEDEVYEKIVARLCGPLTTVKVYTDKHFPRVKLQNCQEQARTNNKPGQKKFTKPKLVMEEAVLLAGAARVLARRFSELVLLEDQIEVLQRNEDFVHLEGPPGTGKTLVLLLRILTWLDDGHMVWLVSLSPPSRSVTHVLMEQVRKMIDRYHNPSVAKELKNRLHLFMMTRDQSTLDEEYYRRLLLKFRDRAKVTVTRPYVGYPRPPTLPPVTAPHDRKMCLVLDECGMSGAGLHGFFNQVAELHRARKFVCQEFDKGLSVWSASLERVGRPCYVTDGTTDADKFGVLWTLKLPIRCPPTVQRALILVQPALDQNNVCCFEKDSILSHPMGDRVQYAADGLPVHLIAHGSHKQQDKNIWHCSECGDALGKFLQKTLRIGQEQCDCPGETTDYEGEVNHGASTCSNCGKMQKGSFPSCDRPLKFNDVMIVATQKAFRYSVPIGGFLHALAKRKLKISINTTREEGDAPVPPDDVILIADITSIHGLERAVIIVVPETTSAHDTAEAADPGMETDPIDDGVGNGCQGLDPVFIKHDPKLKKALERSDDVFTIAAEEVVDVDMRDMQAERDMSSSAAYQMEVEEIGQQEMHDKFTEVGLSELPVPAEEKDPHTYADWQSETQIKAALASLSPQSRRDVFYIGSRAVCQLILIHQAKNPQP